MKTGIIFLFFLLMRLPAFTQINLLPNSGFEDYIKGPSSVTINNSVISWSSFRGTCDYFNSCAPVSCPVTVPGNVTGFQVTHSGNGYCGFLVGIIQDPAFREFLGAQLLLPLQVGTRYYLTFHVSLADGFAYRLPMNKIGAFFSTVPYDVINFIPTQNFAHIFSDSIISDTLGWTKISGSFIADSAYNYIAFGNFFGQQFISTLPNWQTYFESYFYIDDVCLSADSVYCNLSVATGDIAIQPEISIFTDPLNEQVKIQSVMAFFKGTTIQVYDVFGKVVYMENHNSSVEGNTITIPITNFRYGLYFIEITFNDKRIVKKFLKI